MTLITKDIFRNIVSVDATRTDIENAVFYCIEKTRYFILRERKWSEPFFGLRIDDFILDIIAPLFARDKENRCIVFAKFLKNKWNLTDADFEYSLNGLLLSNQRQELQRLTGANDAFGKYISNVINHQIKKYPNLRKEKLKIGMTIFPMNDGAILIEKEELIRMLANGLELEGKHSKTINQAIGLIEINQVRVKISDLIGTLKQFLNSGMNIENPELPEVQIEYKDRLEIMETVFKNLKHKLLALYVEKGKLTNKETRNMASALDLIYADMSNGGMVGSLKEYVLIVEPKITAKEYKNVYRNKMEYMLKIIRKKMSAILNS